MKKRLLYGLLLLFACISGSVRVWALEPDDNGVYQIGTAQDLMDFAALVNNGQYGAKAVLTADITLTEPWTAPIGVITGDENGAVGPGAYAGSFDGQGHKISGFNAESTGLGHVGLFGDANGATIKNFSIEGTLTVTGGHGSGVIAYLTNCIIDNVHSALVIDVPVEKVCHVGGLVGSSRGGSVISNCTFSGTIAIASGSTDCFAGIVGYLGGDNVLNCVNYGNITFSDPSCAIGGIVAYLNNTTSNIKGCMNMGKIVCDAVEETPKYGSAIVGRLRNYDKAKVLGNCWLKGSAYGAGLNDNGGDDLSSALCFTDDMLATGEVCYELNGDQTTISWYQTLGTDNVPVLDATHAQVYKIGHKHCDGSWYDEYTFSNTSSEIPVDDHHFVNGVCDYCGFIDEEAIANSMVLNADGFYEIGNAPQFMWFAKYVNDGHPDANAILTANISFARVNNSSNPWSPVGSTDSYKGTFDGKGFTISDFEVTSNGDHYGLFGKLTGGAVVKNFTIEGTINSLNQYVGVIGSAGGGTVNISDIHSKVDINCSKSRHGGILGFQSSTGTINIKRCIYSGTLDAGKTNGNLGGIVGLGQNNASAYINITDCLFDGTILDDGGNNAGGIVGYANKTKVTIKNCLSVGTIVAPNPSPFIGQLNASNSKWAGKNYYTTEGNLVGVPGSGVTVSGTEPVETDEDQLTYGEVCYELNEGKFPDAAWRQTIEVEKYPKPTNEGDFVYLFNDGYQNITNDNIAELISDLVEVETEFIENEDLIAYKALVDEYKAAIQTWESIDNLNDFLTAYKAAAVVKDNINKSVAKYIKYDQTCDNAAKYLEENDLEGKWVDFLLDYLDGSMEPCKDYPNGGYLYIKECLNLDDDALTAEIAFVNQMLENAIAGGITAGTEITRLMSNSDFTNGFDGWTTEYKGGSITTGGVEGRTKIARGLSNNSFNFYQTVKEIPNGVYLMTINGLFRSGSDIYSKFYAGQLYLNNTSNYVMSIGEDYITESDAKPNENCLGESGDAAYAGLEENGFVPKSINGCSYAFSANRYLNFCATEVTDSTLTIGVRNLGTGMTNDWLPFGNVHVVYLGTAEEANEKLAEVLAGYAQRAQVIIDFKSNDELDKFMIYPNMSVDLKNRLSDAIAAIDGAVTGAEKLALINSFSALFNEVNACRKSYIAMYDAANKLYDVACAMNNAGILSDEDFYQWEDETGAARDNFVDGKVSTEEAQAMADRFNSTNLVPIPKSEDGVYQLSTARQLMIYGKLVNSGYKTEDAVLTADIDMSELSEDEKFEPIGKYLKNGSTLITDYAFKGTFDGQGHSIKNFVHVATDDGNGLFGIILNATVKNFRISGTLTSDGHNYNGVVGMAEGTSVVSGVYSDMDVNVSNCGAHSGGIVGGCSTSSKILVEYCEYAGTMTHRGSGDCQAGILGYTYAGGVKNCIFSGTIDGETSKYGGILAYCKIPGFQGVQNCLSIGKIVSNSAQQAAIIASWNGGVTTAVTNNYYCLKEGSTTDVAIGNKTANCEAPHAVTVEQLASGEVCYKLNGENQEMNSIWYQTLGEDASPVLDNTHKIVFYDDVIGYHNLSDDEWVAIDPIIQTPDTDSKVIYNLAGQRMSRLQKGINIIGGKKYFVK
ncbi:MAG: hypothetical protein K6F47_06175 [Bacteroidaceae bacterium]|nr:hypothetical protein [Bacteroidaceae bacterium]